MIAGCAWSDQGAVWPTPEIPTATLAAAEATLALTPSVVRATRSPAASPSAPAPDGDGIVVHRANGELILEPLVGAPFNGFPLHEVYSGLVRIGDSPGHDVEPELAASWDISDDGLLYTFTLREDLRFSDGSSVTADDAKWSWERALTPGFITRWSSELFGTIVGAQEMMRGRARELAGATVVDPLTLAVRLERPTAHFLAGLASPAASVLSENNVRNWGTWDWVRHEKLAGFDSGGPAQAYAELPDGTGPFRIAAYDGTHRVVLEPNPYYWRGTPHLTQLWIESPNIRRVESLDEITSLNTDVGKFEVIAVDAGTMDSVAAGLEAWLDGVPLTDRVPHIVDVAPQVSWLAFNTALPPYDNVDLRRALLRSAVRKPEPRNVYILDGVSNAVATGLLPPTFEGHQTQLAATHPDRATAEALLAESGVQTADGGAPVIVIAIDRAMPNHAVAADISRNWTEWLGLAVTNHNEGISMTWDEFQQLRASGAFAEDDDLQEDSSNELGAQLTAGTLQMRYVHAVPSYPDPCAILCRVPDLFGPNAQSDETRQLRELLHDAAATADRAARIAKYQTIEAHILDRALVIPVFWDDGTTYRLVKPYISGYKVPAYGGSQYEGVVVDTTHPDYPRERLSGGGGG